MDKVSNLQNLRMIICHFFAHIGTGFFAKPYAPKVPVWTLVALALLPDILSIFLHSALWITHGLIMGVVWAVVATFDSMDNHPKETTSPTINRKRSPANINDCIFVNVWTLGV